MPQWGGCKSDNGVVWENRITENIVTVKTWSARRPFPGRRFWSNAISCLSGVFFFHACVVVSVIPLKRCNIPFTVLYVVCDVAPCVCWTRLLGSPIKLVLQSVVQTLFERDAVATETSFCFLAPCRGGHHWSMSDFTESVTVRAKCQSRWRHENDSPKK